MCHVPKVWHKQDTQFQRVPIFNNNNNHHHHHNNNDDLLTDPLGGSSLLKLHYNYNITIGETISSWSS